MKHRRFFIIIALSLALCAVSCAAPHEHVYAEDWTFDEAAHWKQPLCGDISPVKEAHVFEGSVCTICDYIDPHATPTEDKTPSTQLPEEGKRPEEQTPSGGESQPPEQIPEQRPEGQMPSGEEIQKPEESQTPEQRPEEQTPSGEEIQKPEESQTPEQKPGQGEVLFEEPSDQTITGIPDPDGLVTYRVRVNRYNGRKIYGYPWIKVTDSGGQVLYDNYLPLAPGAAYSETEFNMKDFRLPAGEYRVELSKIPRRFEYQPSYTFSDKHPLLDIRLICHPTTGKVEKIEEGTVLPDFEIHSVNKGDTTLGALLQENRMIVMSFFYNGCLYCQQECAIFKKIYRESGDKFTFLLYDMNDRADAIMGFLRSESWFGDLADRFYVVCDKENEQFYQKIVYHGIKGVPTNVFIDNGGYIFEVTGGMIEERLNRILTYNTFLMPQTSPV